MHCNKTNVLAHLKGHWSITTSFKLIFGLKHNDLRKFHWNLSNRFARKYIWNVMFVNKISGQFKQKRNLPRRTDIWERGASRQVVSSQCFWSEWCCFVPVAKLPNKRDKNFQTLLLTNGKLLCFNLWHSFTFKCIFWQNYFPKFSPKFNKTLWYLCVLGQRFF
jgi:hypothetical protein